jgi:uncharacterized protein YggE
MKKIAGIIMILFFTNALNAQVKTFLDMPYLEVSGNADTLVTPNQIWIGITISEADVKNKVSLEEQERKMVAALKALGINTEKNLVTSGIQSDFRFYVLKQKDVMKSKEYQLMVTDAVTATKVFIKLEEIGIANASVEKVGHSEMEKIRNTCRSNAILNARQKALALTVPVGAGLGSLLHVADYSGSDNGLGNGLMARVRGISTMADKEEELPQIDFEKIKVSMNIQAKFAIK